ncbi:MAG: MFS transporter [Chloroflexota bacterium]|nr:MFS transporter [Chloroflexota bacterium]
MSAHRKNALQTLRHRNFRMLWIADSVAILGSQIQNVAIIWNVFALTEDPFQLGLLGLFRFVPVLFFGLYGGVIADRRDRRSILVVTHILLMAITAVLMVGTVLDAVTMPLIYGVTFVASAVNAFAGPARQAIIPALVPREEIAGAATVLNLAMQTAQIGGPALGGIIIGTVGLTTAYAVGTVSFVAVIIAALLITVREKIVIGSSNGLTAVVDGLKFLWTTPILLAVMSLDFIATFFAASITLMPIFAEQILSMGPDGLGFLLSAPAVGAVVGSLVMSVAPIPQRPGLGIVLAVFAYGACIVGFGLSSMIWLSLLFLAGSGAADAISMAMRHSIRNLVTPAAYRGRIAAAHTTFARGGPQLGEVRSGVMASLFGAQAAVALGGVATVIGCLLMARIVPSLMRYRTEPVEVSDEGEPVVA